MSQSNTTSEINESSHICSHAGSLPLCWSNEMGVYYTVYNTVAAPGPLSAPVAARSKPNSPTYLM